MSAIQKQFNVGENVRIGMAPLNRPATNLISKWSKLYQIVAVKGVVATVLDPATKESVTVHVDRLAFSSLLLRDELARGHVVSCDVPFRSVSNSSLHDLCGEVPVEPPSLPWPTPLHGPSPTPVSLDFLDQPRPEGKRNVRRNRDPEFAYLFMSRAELTSPDYSGARHDKIRREQSRRMKLPPL